MHMAPGGCCCGCELCLLKRRVPLKQHAPTVMGAMMWLSSVYGATAGLGTVQLSSGRFTHQCKHCSLVAGRGLLGCVCGPGGEGWQGEIRVTWCMHGSQWLLLSAMHALAKGVRL